MNFIKKGKFWTARGKGKLFMSADMKQALDKLNELGGKK